MHKTFYASGFLYHLDSEQILLQQHMPSAPLSPWFLFGGIYSEKVGPEAAFKDVVFDLLNIKIKNVYPVYSYFNENASINQSIVYSELKTLRKFSPKKGLTFAWFSFRD